MNKLLISIRSFISIAINLIKHGGGFKYKFVIVNYLLRNLSGRFFSPLKPKRYIHKNGRIEILFAPGQSELSPYPEICHEKIYRDARFIQREVIPSLILGT